jgi:hypothetical protein
MQNFKLLQVLLLFTLILLPVAQLFSQNHKSVPPTEIIYLNSSSTNDNKSFTKVQPQQKEFSTEKKALLQQLDEARTSNNIQRKEQIESLLNGINGSEPVQLTENHNIIGGSAMGNNKPPFNNEHDYNTIPIVFAPIRSSATQTTPAGFPTPGTIWVATTIYNSSGSDTCKLYFSNDGGATWTAGYFFSFTINMDFRPGELDIELAYDGNVVWIYGVAGYNDLAANRASSILFRFNTTANSFNGYTLLWPGNATTTNLYYNPRITSDNSNYIVSPYIYLTCSFDSTYSGTSHYTRQKYAHLTNPYAATPTINYSMPAIGGGSFYWRTATVAAGSYLWTDLAYFKTSAPADRIITVYNVPGTIPAADYNLHLAWSDDYGATITGFSTITETNVDYGAKIAFNGGPTNYNGMIAYVRQSSGNDWDPFYRGTIDGGTNWTSGFIDASSNRCRIVDLIAVRNAANMFKVGYVQDSTAGTYGYYTGGNGVTGFILPNPLAISPVGVDSTFTKVIAGYANDGDDCFAVYSMGSGANIYGSRLCLTTIGIINNNNGVPKVYWLSQNYPNPFNPSTSIHFAIPKSGFVKLTVTDITGKEVKTLVNEQLIAGNYDYNFDASNFASGVYFYKITADDFADTKKMVLIK